MKQLILILLLAALYSGSSSAADNVNRTTEIPTNIQSNDEHKEESNVIHLTDENYYDTLNNSSGVVLVDFWATWCGPCLELSPVLEEISAETGITIYKVDVDECPNISNDFNITAIPNVLVYKDGENVEYVLGFSDKRTYIDLIDRYNND